MIGAPGTTRSSFPSRLKSATAICGVGENRASENVVSAPNGRALDSVFYQAKLVWFERLSRWLADGVGRGTP